MPDALCDPRDIIHDVESYPNYFCATFKHVASGQRWIFEIFDGVINQSRELVAFTHWCASHGCRWVGFNNLGYDYEVLHHIAQLVANYGTASAADAYQRSQAIFAAQQTERFGRTVPPWKRIVKQIDLYKIHHFDNQAKRTGLKVLEFNMRSHSVQDIPFSPLEPLERHQTHIVLGYNCHDVNETERLYGHTFPMIQFRDELSTKYERDFLNDNDTKIGKQYFIQQLDSRRPGLCFNDDGSPRQTFRNRGIPLAQIIFPTVQFHTPEFARVLDYLRSVTITDTYRPVELKDLHAVLRGFRFDFGTGGIHGSLSGVAVHADDDHELIDIDVASYYPNLAIMNRVYPLHLTELFCDVYSDLYEQRKKTKKGSTENGMFKLALNGVFGDSNNIYGPFYDPAYTMTITINGQLLLCMLAEWMLAHPSIYPIQINTDGMTLKVHKSARAWFDQVYAWWQQLTGLTLETANYQSMFIRDVNNYLAVGTTGKIKRKGAYEWYTGEPNNTNVSLAWHQDWSNLVVPKAAEAALVRKTPVSSFIATHDDPFDFMMRLRATGKTKLTLSDGTTLPQTIRYYIASTETGLVKIMPPTATQLDKHAAKNTGTIMPDRQIRQHVGWHVAICNEAYHFDWARLDRRWYIEEANKLVEAIQ